MNYAVVCAKKLKKELDIKSKTKPEHKWFVTGLNFENHRCLVSSCKTYEEAKLYSEIMNKNTK